MTYEVVGSNVMQRNRDGADSFVATFNHVKDAVEYAVWKNKFGAYYVVAANPEPMVDAAELQKIADEYQSVFEGRRGSAFLPPGVRMAEIGTDSWAKMKRDIDPNSWAAEQVKKELTLEIIGTREVSLPLPQEQKPPIKFREFL